MRRVVIVAPLPPPIGGAAKNTERVRRDLTSRGVSTVALRTNPISQTAHRGGIAYHARKVTLSAWNLARLTLMRLRTANVYFVPDGGTGIWISVLYAVVFSLKARGAIVVHHRNASFVRSRHPAIAMISRVLSDRAQHVFLEREMKDRFAQLYGEGADGMVLRNAATCDVEPSHAGLQPPHQHVTVGYLSNLNRDKGFDVVASTFETLAAEDPHLRFALAGPPTSAEARITLDRLIGVLGTRLHYAGSVSGSSKTEFFRGVDVFVFPTRFRQEAQPNVLYEAMASGCSIVSTAHALIPHMLDDAPHTLVPLVESRLVSATTEAVREEVSMMNEVSTRMRRKASAVAAFVRIRRQASYAYEGLLNLLSVGCTTPACEKHRRPSAGPM